MVEGSSIDKSTQDTTNKVLNEEEFRLIMDADMNISWSLKELFPILPLEMQKYLYSKHGLLKPDTHDNETINQWCEQRKEYIPPENFQHFGEETKNLLKQNNNVFHLENILKYLPEGVKSFTLGEVIVERESDEHIGIEVSFIGDNANEGIKFFSQVLSPDDFVEWEDSDHLVNYLEKSDWGLMEVLRWLGHLGASKQCSSKYEEVLLSPEEEEIAREIRVELWGYDPQDWD